MLDRNKFLIVNVSKQSEIKSQILATRANPSEENCLSEDGAFCTQFSYNKTYLETFYGAELELFKQFLQENGIDPTIDVTTGGNPWVNIYKNGNYFPEHSHWSSKYSAVHVVQQGANSGALQFFSKESNSWITPEVGEGQIIFYAGNVLHRCSKNTSNSERIICAFSTNFHEDAQIAATGTGYEDATPGGYQG
jgi:hypothetical protein